MAAIFGPDDVNSLIRTFVNIGKYTYKTGKFLYDVNATASERANNRKMFDQLSNNEKKDLILNCLNNNMTFSQICKNFNLSENEVNGILSGVTRQSYEPPKSNANATPSTSNNGYLFLSIIAVVVIIIIIASVSKTPTTRTNFENKVYESPISTQTNQQQQQTYTSSTTFGRFPEASDRLLTASDLQNLSKYDLKIMRNEIFARHGYIFRTNDMKNYFQNQNWYTPRYNDVNSMLTSIEHKNVTLIKRYE